MFCSVVKLTLMVRIKKRRVLMTQEKQKKEIYSVVDLWDAIQKKPEDRSRLVEEYKTFDKKRSTFFSSLSSVGKADYIKLSAPLRRLAIDVALEK